MNLIDEVKNIVRAELARVKEEAQAVLETSEALEQEVIHVAKADFDALVARVASLENRAAWEANAKPEAVQNYEAPKPE
jgi:hypothetical protein